MGRGLVLILLIAAGCHSRPLQEVDTPCPDGGVAHDLGEPPVPDDLPDLAPATGDMTPPLSHYIHCRGSGGEPKWIAPVGAIEPVADIFDVAATYGQEGVMVSRSQTIYPPGGDYNRAGRLSGYGSLNGTLQSVDYGYFDWMLTGTGWVESLTLGSDKTGETVLLTATQNQTLYLGGPSNVTTGGTTEGLLASYD